MGYYNRIFSGDTLDAAYKNYTKYKTMIDHKKHLLRKALKNRHNKDPLFNRAANKVWIEIYIEDLRKFKN